MYLATKNILVLTHSGRTLRFRMVDFDRLLLWVSLYNCTVKICLMNGMDLCNQEQKTDCIYHMYNPFCVSL
jgi:hypothetical protein